MKGRRVLYSLKYTIPIQRVEKKPKFSSLTTPLLLEKDWKRPSRVCVSSEAVHTQRKQLTSVIHDSSSRVAVSGRPLHLAPTDKHCGC